MKRILGYGQQVRPVLRSLIEARAARLLKGDTWGRDLLDRLLPFAASGKLLRGGLVCFAYEMFSGETPTQPVMQAAAALELTHSALLMHDDIIDNDNIRRGRPALHYQYQELGAARGVSDAGRFGRDMAICAGDAALFLAFDLLSDLPNSFGTASAVTKTFAEYLLLVCSGQMQDIYLDARAQLPSKQTLYRLMETKTASYTLSLPLAMGAGLAGQPAAVKRRLERIGRAAGTVFQIRDDELGLFGDAAILGKPVGSDIREGKKTLVYYYLMRQAPAGERHRLQRIFGNPELRQQDIDYVQQLARRCRVPEQLAEDIGRLSQRARAGVAGLPINAADQAELLELIAFCGSRQR